MTNQKVQELIHRLDDLEKSVKTYLIDVLHERCESEDEEKIILRRDPRCGQQVESRTLCYYIYMLSKKQVIERYVYMDASRSDTRESKSDIQTFVDGLSYKDMRAVAENLNENTCYVSRGDPKIGNRRL